MKTFLSSLFTAVTLVMVTAGLSFGQSVVVWPLQSSNADSIVSNVVADTEAVVGLDAAYEVPGAGTTSNVQKLKPDAATSDGTNGTGSWPIESSLNTGRYVEFFFTPQMNYKVTLDSISMMIGAKGIAGVHASVFYSMHSDFSDSMQVSEMGDLIKDAVKDTTLSLADTLMAGDTIFVRVFPWIPAGSGASTSKYLYIGNVAAYASVWTTPMASDGMWYFQSDSLADSTTHIGWGPYNLNTFIADDPVNPGEGNHVLECVIHNYNAAPVLMAVLPAGKTMANYKSFDFSGYFQKGDVGYKDIVVEAYQTKPTAQAFNNTAVKIGSYNRAKNGSTDWENISIPINGSFSMKDTVYFAFGINCSGTGDVGGAGSVTTWFADSIKLVPSTTTASTITMWGITPQRNAPGWKLDVSSAGDTANFHGGPVAAWAGIRGAFKNPLVATTATDGAIVVAGKVTFVGEGPDAGSALRYGYYNNLIPGTLDNTVADSAFWNGFSENSYGYTFAPNSGTSNLPANYGFGGAGAAQWINMGGSWISSYGGAVGIGPVCVLQAPARATMNAGTYDFAFSVHPQTNGTKTVKYYLIQKNSSGKIVYWNAATFTDTTSQTRTDTLNAICWGLAGGADMTGVIFTNVVDSLGPDITIPTQPWQAYYIDQSSFAFYGSRMGGWSLIPGGGYGANSIIGNATVGGAEGVPEYQSMAVRGAFNGEVAPRGVDSNVVVTGDLEFIGGGFQTANSFLFGIFNADSAGSVNKSDTMHYAWTGTEGHNNGYLFVAPSGSSTMPQWPGGVTSPYLTGDAGAVVDGVWLSTVSSKNYMMGNFLPYPANAMAGAGMYHFAVSVGPNGHGAQNVRFMLYQLPDTNYVFQGAMTDTHSPLAASQFNSINLALLGGNSTDTLKITNVQVDLGPALTLLPGKVVGVQKDENGLPKVFALYQNYPNPFNPSTMIRYDIPKTSHVKIMIYDVLGRAVTTLVDAVQQPSSYRLNWNAQRYSSGVYFMRIEARAQDGSANFNSVKKLLFMK